MFYLHVSPEVKLRILEVRDADELISLVDKNRNYLKKWLPWVDTTVSSKDTLNFIKLMLRKYSENGAFDAGIFAQNRLVGIIGLHPISWSNRSTSIGYWLAEDVQGKGIMFQCVKYLLHFVFTDLKLHRVEIRSATGNQRSQNIPKKLGFAFEGICRQSEKVNDEYYDSMVFSILRPEWLQREKKMRS